MTSKPATALTLATFITAFALAGCAVTNPPLMFGDTTTLGLRLGNDTSSAGGSVSFGYKAVSVAMVPVSILNQDGNVELLAGRDVAGDGVSGKSDAMSVFASFTDSSTRAPKQGEPAIAFGQVFSTGLAAQTLTRSLCASAATGGTCPAASAPPTASGSSHPAKRADRSKSTAKATVTASVDGPYQSPLLFMRTDVIGIDIGGTLAQHGLQFVLGYGNKNLALIPVVAMNADRVPTKIAGTSDAAESDLLDTMSVVGQFHARTDTQGLDLGLDRYFATGIAARNLSENITRLAVTQLAAPPAAGASAAAKPATVARN